eukprot:gb/GECG01004966.1/.p1 GENE.gb/GECG01004966.1/~~gb/GECG01004966.1/.p1  ORF type:complete len:661 (+),score=72.01 gb/GECG01004966.1/:1-1983(+)
MNQKGSRKRNREGDGGTQSAASASASASYRKEPAVDVPPYVPWVSWGEWCSVYRALCAAELDSKQWALDRIAAWETRGKVPVAVTSTAHILSCGLHHDFPQQLQQGGSRARTVLEDRLATSMAIVRMVNGLIDPLQTKAKAMSVNGIAKKLGIPRVLVDLRHEATHTQLPSIETLLYARSWAIDWLFTNYWIPQYRRLENISQSKILADILSDLATIRLKVLSDADGSKIEELVKSISNSISPFASASDERQLLDKMYDRLSYCPDTVIGGVLIPMLLDGRPQKPDDLGTTLSSPSVPPCWTFDSPLVPSTTLLKISADSTGFTQLLRCWLAVIYDIQSRIPSFIPNLLRGILERFAHEWRLFDTMHEKFKHQEKYFCSTMTSYFSSTRRFYFLRRWLHFLLSRQWMSLWNPAYACIPRVNNPHKTTNLLGKKSWNSREQEFMNENVSHKEAFEFNSHHCINSGVQYIEPLVCFVDGATNWISIDQWNAIFRDDSLHHTTDTTANSKTECICESGEESVVSLATSVFGDGKGTGLQSAGPSTSSSLEEMEKWLQGIGQGASASANSNSESATEESAPTEPTRVQGSRADASSNSCTPEGKPPWKQLDPDGQLPSNHSTCSNRVHKGKPRWKQLDPARQNLLILPVGSMASFQLPGFLEDF